MTSRKPNRRKTKCKRLMSFCKWPRLKEERISSPECTREFSVQRQTHLVTENLSDRFSSSNESSRFCLNGNRSPRVKKFAKMREYYFAHLQTVVSENCSFCNAMPNVETLKNLSLELEQEALLASLQADIYIEAITEIIVDIEKCTREKQIHGDVRKFLPKANCSEYSTLGETNESNSRIFPNQIFSQKSSPNRESNSTINHSSNSVSQENNEIPCDPSNLINEDNAIENETLTDYYENQSNYGNGTDAYQEHSEIYTNNVLTCKNLKSEEFESNTSNLENFNNGHDFYPSNPGNNDLISINPLTPSTAQNEKNDPLILSLTQLQQSVEQNLDNKEMIMKQKNEEKERAYIAQILEGSEDSLSGRLGYFSDNESERLTKENEGEASLLNRLEKMREIFGAENCSHTDQQMEQNVRGNQLNCRGKKSTIWKHEKIIQQYKFAMLSSEMTVPRQIINKRHFISLFGEDSDDENKFEYMSYERYKASCAERISSWVVRYLMPYYHDRRIIGRQIFKTLGHHICNTIIGKIHYPDEWTVKYFVNKFFPEKKMYVCDSDIFAFEYI